MTATSLDSVSVIDGHYIRPDRAAVFLVEHEGEAAFVDNATRFSVPRILEGLSQRGLTPEQVRYLIVTHVHLDHSGGTAELLKFCPNATVICHQRARRHLIDPTRLVAAATPIYGEDVFPKVFGVIEPIAEERVHAVDDGETLMLGKSQFRFFDSPGHAKHHIAALDEGTNSIFSGDAFGLAPLRLQEGTKPYMSYVASPPDFDVEGGKNTVRRLLETGADRTFVTHYGEVQELEECAEQLYLMLDDFGDLVKEVADTELDGQPRLDYVEGRVWDITEKALRKSGLDAEDDEVHSWAVAEFKITTQGIAYMAQRVRDDA